MILKSKNTKKTNTNVCVIILSATWIETWTLNAEIIRRLQVFEMWVYKRIFKVSWVNRATNLEKLRPLNIQR